MSLNEFDLGWSNDNFVMYVTCLRFSPTQSRILKHSGDLAAAASLADEARCMDLADRYVNSECVKRMLQADQVEIFVMCSLFYLTVFSLVVNSYELLLFLICLPTTLCWTYD